MNRERLLRLAAHLEAVPREKFDLGSWFARYDEDEGYDVTTEYFDPDELHTFVIFDADGNVIGYQRGHCETKACAVGHATSIPEFREAGFSVRCTNPSDSTALSPYFEGLWGWNAVMQFFGLKEDDALHLFGGSGNDPRAVARDIREFVAGS